MLGPLLEAKALARNGKAIAVPVMRKTGILRVAGVLVKRALPHACEAVRLLHSLDAKVHGYSTSIDMLVLQNMKHVVEKFPQIDTLPKDRQPPFSVVDISGRALHSARRIARSLYRLDIVINGRRPWMFGVIQDAKSITEDTLSTLTPLQPKKK